MATRTAAPAICQTQTSCLTCPARQRAICAYCDPDDLQRLEEIRFFRSYERGQTIVLDNQPMDFVASVASGIVSLTKIMPDGRLQMVGMLRQGRFLGQPYRSCASFNAIAATDVVLSGFPRVRFEALLRQSPGLGLGLLEHSLSELEAAREWMLILGRKNARERLASFLELLVREGIGNRVSGQDMVLDLPFTREEIADYLGLTLSTVSRQFGALRDAGIIGVGKQRGITILDYSALLAQTGSDEDGGWPT